MNAKTSITVRTLFIIGLYMAPLILSHPTSIHAQIEPKIVNVLADGCGFVA